MQPQGTVYTPGGCPNIVEQRVEELITWIAQLIDVDLGHIKVDIAGIHRLEHDASHYADYVPGVVKFLHQRSTAAKVE